MLQTAFFDKPAAKVATASLVGRTLRPYQLEAFTGGKGSGGVAWPGIRACLEKYRSTAVVLFTGGGKSSIAAQAAMEATGRVLFLAHLDTLVTQAREELQEITGLQWELEQAGWCARARGGSHVVASVQSLMRQSRLERFAPDAFSLIVVDESHHYVSKAYKRPLDYFAAAKILALTATPKRKDRKALGRYVESVAYKMDLVDGIDAGWSVPVTCGTPVEMAVDLDAVNLKGGDYDRIELDAKVAEAIAPAVQAAMKQCGDWPTIIWAPGVMAVHATAKALNAWRPGCAHGVDGSMPRDQKRSIIAAHKRREYQYLVNCGVLVEGYSDRGLVCMIDAAPTKSDLRVVQRLGRILRPAADVDACPDEPGARKAAIAASGKPQAVWIDLKCNCRPGSLNAPRDAIDILGGTYTDAEKKKARKLLESKGGDPRAALEEARRRIAEKAARAKVRLKMRNFDPTKGARVAAPAGPAPVTPRQLRACDRFGIEATGLSAGEVQKLLRYEFLAEARGWCSHLQRQWLQRNLGVSGKGLPRSKGKELAEAWKRNGKLRLPPAQLASVLHPEPGSAG